MADLLKRTHHYLMPYHGEFGRSALKDAGINTGELQNWEALELRLLVMGGVADPKVYVQPQHVLPRLVRKGVRINRRELPKVWSAWTLSIEIGRE